LRRRIVLKLIKRFILIIQFLTRIPVPVNLNVTAEDFGKGLVFAPVVGLIIGAILAGVYYVLSLIFPAYVTAVFIIIVYIILTGGLHLDGLGDTFDGLFSNRSKERILEIMRDSRVGTNAVLAIACILLLNTALVSAFNDEHIIKVLLLMPVAGRIGSLIGSGTSTYARSGEGLGKSFIDYCGVKEIIIGIALYMLIFYTIGGELALLVSVFPVITALLLTRILTSKIGGATGDILGAVCELNQTLFLVAVYIWQYVV